MRYEYCLRYLAKTKRNRHVSSHGHLPVVFSSIDDSFDESMLWSYIEL